MVISTLPLLASKKCFTLAVSAWPTGSGSRGRTAAPVGVGLRLAGTPGPLLDAFKVLPSVIFVAHTLGRFDVLPTIRAFSSAETLTVLDEIRALPGAGTVESWTHLEVTNETYSSPLFSR